MDFVEIVCKHTLWRWPQIFICGIFLSGKFPVSGVILFTSSMQAATAFIHIVMSREQLRSELCVTTGSSSRLCGCSKVLTTHPDSLVPSTTSACSAVPLCPVS